MFYLISNFGDQYTGELIFHRLHRCLISLMLGREYKGGSDKNLGCVSREPKLTDI